MPQAIWSPEAIAELEEIACYIAIHGGRPITAERLVREAHELTTLIATQPEMGAAHPELGEAYRVFSFK